MVGIRFSAEGKYFSLLHGLHTGSGIHPASYQPGAVGTLSRDWGIELINHLHSQPRSGMVKLHLQFSIRVLFA
jgi:hypothetical protein